LQCNDNVESIAYKTEQYELTTNVRYSNQQSGLLVSCITRSCTQLYVLGLHMYTRNRVT